MPGAALNAVSAAGAEFDMRTQAPEYSYMHSMRAPGQDAASAARARDVFLMHMLARAREAWAAGDCAGALRDFGSAIHPLMDETSPFHTDANGPLDWSGGLGQLLSHAAGEMTTFPTSAQYQASDAMLIAAYKYVFGGQ